MRGMGGPRLAGQHGLRRGADVDMGGYESTDGSVSRVWSPRVSWTLSSCQALLPPLAVLITGTMYLTSGQGQPARGAVSL